MQPAVRRGRTPRHRSAVRWLCLALLLSALGNQANAQTRVVESLSDDAGKVHQVHAATAGHADEELGRRITSICGKPECFPAGTPVLMADGRSMPIEIRPGDLVQSRSPADPLGGMTTSRVLRTKVSRAAGLVEVALSVAGRTGMTSLRATANHPVWVVGDGWRGFGSLAPGDRIIGDDAPRSWIGSVKFRTFRSAV